MLTIIPTFAMYPDHPDSPSDLVPLPRCDGPKLEPFDFKGPREIKFLKYLGRGLYAHVFKVMIRGKLYALKLVSEPKMGLERPGEETFPSSYFTEQGPG